MWDRLHLSLEKSALEESAKAPMALTPFGQLGRYIFLAALELYCVTTNNDEQLAVIKKYKTQAHANMQKELLKKMKVPDFIWKYEADSNTLHRNDKYLRIWYRDYVKEKTDITMDEKNLFVRSVNFMSKGPEISPTGLTAMEKLAWAIGEKMGSIFNESVHQASSIKKDLVKALFANIRETVKLLTGKADIKVDPKLAEKVKIDKKLGPLYEEYRAHIKEAKQIFDKILKRETLGGPIPVKDLEKKLLDIGFEVFFFPSSRNGFQGLVGILDGKMSLYTEHGQLLFGGVHPDAKIKINPQYDPETDNSYYLQYTAPNAVTETRIYTAQYRNKADENKHQSTTDNLGNTDKWVATWRKDLKSKDLMRKVPAVVAYILYMTGARVGSSTESRSRTGKGATHGISTLLVKHVTVTGTSIILKYLGKKQVAQHHIMKLSEDPYFKICAKVIQDLKVGKKSDQLLFAFPRPTSRAGTIQEVNYAFFNKYMKSCGVQHVHGMRHVRGTKLTTELLNSTSWKPKSTSTIKQKQADADKYIKEKILTKVGELLGHKSTSKDGTTKVLWSTCIKSYVNPQVVADWYVQQKLEVPKWVPKKIEE